jgi:uncharacterized protein
MINRDITAREEKLLSFFRDIWGDRKPLANLYRTDSSAYLYDTGTNKLFACSELEATAINSLMTLDLNLAIKLSSPDFLHSDYISALEGIQKQIEDRNILRTTSVIQFKYPSLHALKESVSSQLRMLLLEITERCNLRCSYCIYDPHYPAKRDHGLRDMGLGVAKKAIEHLSRSSSSNKEVGITFYGGEPLLCLPLIKSCVAFAKTLMKDKTITFSITTNGTLITPEIARYLHKEEFSILVSIDGPKDIHDEYRKDTKGRGSFDRAIVGLKNLFDEYGKENKKLGLSMVFSPPYTTNRVSRVAELWDQYKWIPSNIRVVTSYAAGFSWACSQADIEEGQKQPVFDWAEVEFIDKYQNGGNPHPIASSAVERELAYFVQRPVYSGPLQEYSLNGCCTPAARRPCQLMFATSGPSFTHFS